MKSTIQKQSELKNRARMLLGGAGGGAALGLMAATFAFSTEYGEEGFGITCQYLFAEFFHDVPVLGKTLFVNGFPVADWYREASRLTELPQAAETLQNWLAWGGVAGAVLGALAVVLIVNKSK